MRKLLSKTAFVLAIALCSTSCKKNMDQAGPTQEMNSDKPGNTSRGFYTTAELQDFSNKLATKMDGKCAGYSYIISYKGNVVTSKSGGFSRFVPDFPIRQFSVNDRYSIASVSKTITAVALMNTLNAWGGIDLNLDLPMWTYLPSHWVMGPGVKTITYRQLLTHTSGLRYDPNPLNPQNGDDYQTLKNLLAKGIMMFNKVPSYNNRNFALMRLLIPKLAAYNVPPIAAGTQGVLLSALENIQASQFAEDYKDYCRKVIFSKMNSTSGQTIDCKMNDTHPGLCYTFPGNGAAGILAGQDLTLSSAAQGWVLSTTQVNEFFTKLHYSSSIIPASLATMMKSGMLGYDVAGTLSDGTTYFWKNGIYFLGNNVGYRSLIIGFSDDIQVTIMANSTMTLEDAATAAHQLWHP